MANYPARLLPAGYQASGWVNLGEIGRSVFLEEILSISSDYFVDGTVNYADSREPILTNRVTGDYQTLRGENIPWDQLATDMGTVFATGGNPMGMLLLAAAGLVLLVGTM